MTSNSLLIAIICGLVTAVLFLSSMSLGSMGMTLSTFTAMPLFVATLGFGTIAGIVSGGLASLIVAVFLGPLGALTILGVTMVPALWIGHSAGLSRNEEGTEEWFPVAQLLVRLAAISAAIAVTFGMIVGYSSQWATKQGVAILTEFSKLQAPANGGAPLWSAEQIALKANDFAQLIPYMMPVTLLLIMVMNLRLAERFVRSRGWMLRPKDDLPADTGLPLYAAGIFVAAVAGGFIGGQFGLISQVIAGAFGGAFVLVGLATVHFITRGMTVRPFLLPVVYITLFFSSVMGPIYAVLGVAETLFQLRRRAASGPPST